MLELLFLVFIGVLFVECVALIITYVTKNSKYFLCALPVSLIFRTSLSFIWGESDSPKKVLLTFLLIMYAGRLLGKFYFGAPNTAPELSFAPSHVIQNAVKYFLPQAILTCLVSIPLLLLNARGHGSLSVLDYCGTFLIIFGLVYETLSDLDLTYYLPTVISKKIKDPRMVARVILWFGFALFALLSPFGYLGLLAPFAVMLSLSPRLRWGWGGILGLF